MLCYKFLKHLLKKKLAKCVGRERGVGKAVSEGHECVPSCSAQGRPQPVQPLVSVGNPESGGQGEVCLVNEPCMSPSKYAAFLLCFPLPFCQLGCVSCSSPVLGRQRLSWFGLRSSSLLLHPCPMPQCYFSLCLLLLQTKRNG